MMKVLLIDDEVSTLKLLPKAIDWEELGLSICGTASDGEEGLELFHRCAPDIIIVDIKMPHMDGLTFSRAVRESGRLVKIILLSAYAEFQFAQIAVQLKISDYLLKPLDENSLREALQRVIREINEEWQRPAAAESGSFYEGDAHAGNALSGMSTINPVLLESGISCLAEQANPLPLIEQLSKLLQQIFERHTDPEWVFEFLLELQSHVRISITRCYGYQAALAVRAASLKELHECRSPDALLCHMTDWVKEVAGCLSSILSADPNHALIRGAKAYVNQHFSEASLSLQSVAEYAGISKNYFSTVFHDVTGTRFWDYITRVRIEEAKRLLSSTPMTNFEICQRVGYDSEYHFCRKFRELVGVTPHQYRTGGIGQRKKSDY